MDNLFVLASFNGRISFCGTVSPKTCATNVVPKPSRLTRESVFSHALPNTTCADIIFCERGRCNWESFLGLWPLEGVRIIQEKVFNSANRCEHQGSLAARGCSPTSGNSRHTLLASASEEIETMPDMHDDFLRGHT